MHLLTIPIQPILPDVAQHSASLLGLLVTSQLHGPRKSVTGQLHPPYDSNTSYSQASHASQLSDKSKTS